jgi:hypothetical protein
LASAHYDVEDNEELFFLCFEKKKKRKREEEKKEIKENEVYVIPLVWRFRHM